MLTVAGLACSEPESRITGPSMAAGQEQSARPAGENHPPRIDSLTLSRTSPHPGDTTVAQAVASDPDGDAVLLSYVWRVDGTVQPATGDTLSVGGTRGARIEVEVTPRDAQASGEPATASATIANQPPVIERVLFRNNAEVASGKDLVAEPDVRDADGDKVEITYRWMVNGGEVESATGPVLPASAFKTGDRIRLAVTASDGTDTSELLESAPLTVGAGKPVITSTVPTDFDADGVFRYQLAVQNPTGGALRYRLIEGPSGMDLDPIEGRVSWKPSEAQQGEHPVKVEVLDSHGAAASQSFKVKVAFETEEAAAPERYGRHHRKLPTAAPAAPAAPTQ